MAEKQQALAALDAMMAQGAPTGPPGGAPAPAGGGGPAPAPGGGDPAAGGGIPCQVCGYLIDPSGAPVGIWDEALAETVAPYQDPASMPDLSTPGAPPGAPAGAPPAVPGPPPQV